MDLEEVSGGSACILELVVVMMVMVEERVLVLGKGWAGFAGRTAVGRRRKKSFDYVL